MPRRLATSFLPAAVVLLHLGQAVAQSTTVTCGADFAWAANSLGQNPCKIAAYLGSECTNPPNYIVAPLTNQSGSISYHLSTPPTRCECNTVMYSLLSACTACQDFPLTSWPTYSANCSSINTSFPLDVDSETRIPAWAMQDVISSQGQTFNVTLAQFIGDSPEISSAPSAPSQPSNASVSSSPTPSITTQPTHVPSSSSSNTGIIAGAAAGGVVVLCVGVGALYYYLARRTRFRLRKQNHSSDSLQRPGKLKMHSPTRGAQTLEDEDDTMIGSGSSHFTHPTPWGHHMSMSTANATFGTSRPPPMFPPYSTTSSSPPPTSLAS